MRNILLFLLFSISVQAQTFTGLKLRGTTHSPYTNLNRQLTWSEGDQNFVNLGDAIRALQASSGGGSFLPLAGGIMTGNIGISNGVQIVSNVTGNNYIDFSTNGAAHQLQVAGEQVSIYTNSAITSQMALANGSLSIACGNNVSINLQDAGSSMSFLSNTHNAILFNKATGYSSDYSTNYNSRSFIDKGYADATYAITTNPLSQFASTTSLQLKNVISDETGSGAAVFATSPTLVTPVLGVATATQVTLNSLYFNANGGISRSITVLPNSGTNVTGTDLVLQPGAATGSGASPNLVFYAGSPVGSSGTSVRTVVEIARVTAAGFTTAFDVEITDTTKGLILKSPDGTRYRITVANGGTLTVTGL